MALPAAAGFGVAFFSLLLKKRNDHIRNVFIGRHFNGFKARGGIHLHDHRPMIGPKNVDAANV